MTVFLGTSSVLNSRPASCVLLALVVAFGIPMRLTAEPVQAGDAMQDGQTQGLPVKPSADVPVAGSLPDTPPTTTPLSATSPATSAPAQHLDVDFTSGKITVDASNASLNGVLHGVAAKAGIKITGNVSDERVFGHYGPAAPAAILALLLEGTSTNMILVDDAKGASELVLTARSGGPTPPSPLSAANEVTPTDDLDGRPSRYNPPVRPFQPQGPGRGPSAEPSAFESNIPPGRPGAAGAAGSRPDSPQSTGDTRTPQQIYDQLQNQQKQNDAQTPQ